jgi:hypothetical protein
VEVELQQVELLPRPADAVAARLQVDLQGVPSVGDRRVGAGAIPVLRERIAGKEGMD